MLKFIPRIVLEAALRAALVGVIVTLSIAALPHAGFAQQTEVNPTIVRPGPDGSVARKIELGIGKSFIFDLPRDAKEVFVANPKVANAVVRSSRKIFVIGLADGATSMFILDQEGRQIATAEIAIGRDMNLLRKLLKTAMPTAEITVVPVGDSIVLSGSVDSAAEAAQALDIAKGFIGTSSLGGGSASTGGGGGTSISIGSSQAVEGKVVNSLTIRGKDQVMLKVTVAEVQRSVLKQLGVNINGDWKVGNFALNAVTDNTFPLQLQDPTSGRITGGTNGATNFSVRAFERAGVLRTLAEPTLTAISGETAKFTAGGEVPVPQSETCSVTAGTSIQSCQIGIQFKPFGVALVFQPIVLSAGRISIRVATEVTEIDAENSFKFNTTVVPAFKVRKSDTTVELPSGGSLVAAGMIQHQQKQMINGTPALMNLPILGALFRSRDYQKSETELMMIVTPFIAKPSSASNLPRPDEGFVEAKDPQTTIMGRLNRIYGVAGAPNDGGRYRGHVGFIAD
ncbi:type II and III secretion system protein family protein [Terrarubrum flagellatum]|uniref:type II and III secretion system protein family protein n=1 Tax=Terrirubrum flagellatum TaxID=2895980 RepID=UPI0031450790